VVGEVDAERGCALDVAAAELLLIRS
jgi:hypothetical protein